LPEDYNPTVFDNYSVNVTVDSRQINIGLWDTAGKEDHDRLRPLCYPGTDVFLICFAIDTPTSFANVKDKWWPEILHHARGVPIIIVGTKLDLRGEGNSGDFITKAQGEQLKEEIKAYKYLECSADIVEGVDTVVEEAVRCALARQLHTENRKRLGRCEVL
jgi:Ras-related C3 botulinum toxin substrate 1